MRRRPSQNGGTAPALPKIAAIGIPNSSGSQNRRRTATKPHCRTTGAGCTTRNNGYAWGHPHRIIYETAALIGHIRQTWKRIG